MKREKKPIIAFTKCCIVCKANLRQDSAGQILMATVSFKTQFERFLCLTKLHYGGQR